MVAAWVVPAVDVIEHGKACPSGESSAAGRRAPNSHVRSVQDQLRAQVSDDGVSTKPGQLQSRAGRSPPVCSALGRAALNDTSGKRRGTRRRIRRRGGLGNSVPTRGHSMWYGCTTPLGASPLRITPSVGMALWRRVGADRDGTSMYAHATISLAAVYTALRLSRRRKDEQVTCRPPDAEMSRDRAGNDTRAPVDASQDGGHWSSRVN
jgi:hypothetical protein